MALRLTPKDESFYDLFAVSSGFLVAGAKELAAMLGATPAERVEIAKRMSDIERDADEANHQIIRRVNASFITPFSREDIHALAVALDECVDHMDAALDLVVLYQVDEVLPRVTKQVDVLGRMAELTADAVPRLRSMTGLADYLAEIGRLEKRANKAYRRMLAELFNTPGADPITVMKHKEIIDSLEAAANTFEKVAHTVEGIAVKET